MFDKNLIIGLLKDTKRDGIENLITYMEESGFFTAPCSTQHHLCVEGGLAEHSYNVFQAMDNFVIAFFKSKHHEMLNSIVLCSLLHDIGKMGQFGKPYYTENYLSKCDKEGNPIRSTAKPYITNVDLFNVPHEVRSIAIISRYIDLTEEEQFAILYHNGLYGDLKYQISGHETELYMALHTADMICSRFVETEVKSNGE